METIVRQVTPDLASAWIKAVSAEKQRKLSSAKVSQYAAQMRAGTWALNHQGIAFDVDGNLCDGQHRLNAIVMSGTPVMMMVTYGVPVKYGDGAHTFDTIDCGMPRSVSNQLQVRHGVQNSLRATAAIRAIAYICVRTPAPISVSLAVKINDYMGDIIQNVIKRSASDFHASPSSVLGAVAFCQKAVHGPSIDAFVEGFFSGANLSVGNPALAMRNYVLTHASRRSTSHATAPFALMLCAMHAVKGNSLSQVKYSSAGADYFCDLLPDFVAMVREQSRPTK